MAAQLLYGTIILLVSVAQWNNNILVCCATVHIGWQDPGSNPGHVRIFRCLTYEINFSDEYQICKYLPDFSLYLMLIIRAYVVLVYIS